MMQFEQQTARLSEFLRRGYAGEMHYLAEPLVDGVLARGNVKSVFAATKSIVSVALPYAAPAPVRLKSGNKSLPVVMSQPYVAQYARGEDYHVLVKRLLHQLADEIADLSGRTLTVRACVDSAPLYERDLAVSAGLAFIGKNTLAIAPGLGSHFVLGELLVDLELVPNATQIADGCGSCRACLDICPTSAFVSEGVMDASKCISYLTIESRGAIPHDLRSKVGLHVFGCDLCQAACPFNHGKATLIADARLSSSRFSNLDPGELLHIGSSPFKRLVSGTALRRVNREQLMRNVAVAIGNTGESRYVPTLVRAITQHIYPLVQQHAAWALIRLSQHFQLVAAQSAVKDILAEDGAGARLLQAEMAAFSSD